MGEHSKFNMVYRLQKWMDSVPGQTFLNYAYSWGASVVILGTLFKLTHLPGANVMLFLGMGTEVVVFFISAFDRPFDKTAEGRELPTHVTEEYLETGRVVYDNGQPGGTIVVGGGANADNAGMPGMPGTSGLSGVSGIPEDTGILGDTELSGDPGVSGNGGTVIIGGGVASGPQQNYVPQMSTEEAEALNEAQGNYVEELKKLVDTLAKVNEQSARLTRDSEEMENLNRTLTGISKVYEMQLKGASQQIGTIDQINEQSRKLAQQIEQLNKIYSRMIEAMTVNMRAAAPGSAAGNAEV